jgi:DNA-binding transcriptional ArsR family regulator
MFQDKRYIVIIMKQRTNTELKAYLNFLFEIDLILQDYAFPGIVPIYLVDGYRFQMTSAQGINFITMEPTVKEYRLPTLVKHLAKASQLSGLACVLVLSSLRSSQRNALIQQHVPFLVPGAQLYLPFAGCAFTEKKTNALRLPEALAPGAQLVFLYLYYRKSSSAVTASELALQLKLSKATLTRAVSALEQLGLISVRAEGTKKLLTPAIAAKGDLLNNAKPFLQSPVQQTIYLSKQPENAFLGGILALSSQTMLSATKMDGSYVVSTGQVKELESDKISKQDFLDFGGFPVEVWKYDPVLLSDGKTVDTISLILSFNQEYDERTEQALQSVKDDISW